MQSYLQIEGLTKSYGDRLLFADVTFGVYQGDKIGIVARNGAGKSTFMNILAGKEDYDSGKIVFSNDIRVGYLEQTPDFPDNTDILTYATPAPRNTDDWNAPDRAKQMLGQLGIHDFTQSLHTLSGGQAKRVALAKVLLSDPDMLFLDEPTNHLDIEITEWLENYLKRSKMTLLMVTHDRYFLDIVCSKIIEIDREQLFTYEGNFDYYLRKRAERIDAMNVELARVKNLLRTESEWMSRQPQARGSKAKYRIDNFHQLKEKSRVNLREDKVELRTVSSYIGSKIFEARGVTKAFGDIRIINDWNYDFARYEKVGIVGGNGVGKSTFIKMLLGEEKPDSGRFVIGQTVRWGYYSQEGMVVLDENKKVIDAVREIAEEVKVDDRTRMSASQFLNMFLFSPATQQSYIHKLSGGERRRLYLATVLMKSPNFLVLDEPTNDLDIMTLAVLEDYLANFKGCVIIVSHDRFFLDRIVDHLFVFEGDGVIRDFPGDFSTYRHCVRQLEKEKRQQTEGAADKTAQKEVSGKNQKVKTEQKPRLTFKEKREKEDLEKRLEALEKEKGELESLLSGGMADGESIGKAAKRLNALGDELDGVEMRLLELLEKEG